MKTKKVYATTVDVDDPINYSASPDVFVANTLRRQLVNRNYRGAFITNILRILKISECRPRSSDNSGVWYVEVQFEAEVVVVGRWDIVTGAEVAMLTPATMAMSRTEGEVALYIVESPETKVLRVGQRIPVRLLDVSYQPLKSAISAMAVVLTCDKDAPSYKVSGHLTSEDVEFLSPLREKIAKETERRTGLDKKELKRAMVFEQMLYAYDDKSVDKKIVDNKFYEVATREVDGWTGPGFAVKPPPGTKTKNLLKIYDDARAKKGSEQLTGVWCRDLALYRTMPFALHAPKKIKTWKTPAAVSPRVAWTFMMNSVYNFLRAINEMAEYYGETEFENHKNVWMALRQAQRKA